MSRGGAFRVFRPGLLASFSGRTRCYGQEEPLFVRTEAELSSTGISFRQQTGANASTVAPKSLCVQLEVAALLSGHGSESSRLQLAFLVAATRLQASCLALHTLSTSTPCPLSPRHRFELSPFCACCRLQLAYVLSFHQDMEGSGRAAASFVAQLLDGEPVPQAPWTWNCEWNG